MFADIGQRSVRVKLLSLLHQAPSRGAAEREGRCPCWSRAVEAPEPCYLLRARQKAGVQRCALPGAETA